MKKGKRIIGFICPSLAGVCCFYLIPFCVIIYYSFLEDIISKKIVFLDNYRKLFDNQAFILASINTLKFSGIAVPTLIALSLFFSAILDEKAEKNSVYRTIFLSPILVPAASIVLVWQSLFHSKGILGSLFQIDWLKSEYGMIVVVILFIWKNLGYNMILFSAALASVPKELIEVAILENARPIQIFFRIKIRYIFSSIVYIAIMSLINSFKIFREIYLLTGDYPYETVYFLQSFMNNMIKSLDYQKLSAAAIVMSMIMIVVISIMLFLEEVIGKELEI